MKWTNAIIILICFGVYLMLFDDFSSIKTKLDSVTGIGLFSYILTYLLVGLPLFAGTFLLDKTQFIFSTLGLNTSISKGFIWAFLFSIPMFLGAAFCFDFHGSFSWDNFIAKTFLAGFFEELFYRGFLFGLLFRYTRFGFLSAMLLSSIPFGLGHLWQGNDFISSSGIFGITFLGGLLFCWLFVEWKFNLWICIFLHAFMNAIWYLFQMDDSAAGGLNANVIRALTIAAAIGVTLYVKRSRGEVLVVKPDIFWIKSKN